MDDLKTQKYLHRNQLQAAKADYGRICTELSMVSATALRREQRRIIREHPERASSMYELVAADFHKQRMAILDRKKDAEDEIARLKPLAKSERSADEHEPKEPSDRKVASLKIIELLVEIKQDIAELQKGLSKLT